MSEQTHALHKPKSLILIGLFHLCLGLPSAIFGGYVIGMDYEEGIQNEHKVSLDCSWIEKAKYDFKKLEFMFLIKKVS